MPASSSPLYLPPSARPELEDADVVSVYLVVNGSLGMGPGKTSAQCFQGCLALYRLAETRPGLKETLAEWEAQGWRTVVRVAETAGVFERVCSECDGVLLEDEGLTEVPDGARTLLVTVPYRRGDAPKALAHKRVPLL